MNWFNKISSFLTILAILLAFPQVNHGVKQNKLDASLHFYPAPAMVSKSYPNLFFQIGTNVHVRDTSTGHIQQIIKIENKEIIADCDRDSVLLYCPNKSNDEQFCYKRFDLSGSNESFVIKRLVTEGIKQHPQNMAFVNKKPYFFYETGGTYNKSYKFTVQSPAGILWTSTNGENEWWGYGGCFSYKDVKIVAISVINSSQNFSTKLFDLATGKQINTLEGCFDRTNSPNSDSPIILFDLCTQDRGLCLYDIDRNEIIYRKQIPNWYSVKQVNDSIWITTVEDKSNQYNFGKSGPIRLLRIDSKGNETESITFKPAIPNLPIYSCQMITDQVVGLVARYKTIIWNFRTNQKLCEFDMNNPEFYATDDNYLIGTRSQLTCIDSQTLKTVWKLDVAIPLSIIEFETKDKIYLLNNVIDFKKQCDATQVKIVNNADGSLEPYEFFVSPFYGDPKRIYDSPYGLVFISDYNICSFTVGGIERFSIRDLYGIQSWKPMDDPRYVEIKYRSDRTYKLDTKTGVFSLVVEQQ